MGRRRLWIIVGTALALAVVVVLSLAVLRPGAPFRFLDGREAIGLPRIYGRNATAYSWKENWQAVVAIAKPELTQEGFDVSQTRRHYEFVREVGPGPVDFEIVVIFQNTRLRAGRESEVAEGWVTVFLDMPPRSSLWDRIKAVFGL